jgi:hypothetical protein
MGSKYTLFHGKHMCFEGGEARTKSRWLRSVRAEIGILVAQGRRAYKRRSDGPHFPSTPYVSMSKRGEQAMRTPDDKFGDARLFTR